MSDKSITNGASASAADDASTVARSPRSARSAKKNTGGARKKSSAASKPPKPTLSLADHLTILQSAVTNVCQAIGHPVDVRQGTGERLQLTLPRSIGMCREAGCYRLFPTPELSPNLYCDAHKAAHSTAEQIAFKTVTTIEPVQTVEPIKELYPPNCRICGTRPERPKCLMDLPPDQCPRYEYRDGLLETNINGDGLWAG